MRFLHGGFERWHVDFAQRSLANDFVDRAAIRFLIVGDVVLYIRDHPGALDALDVGDGKTGRKIGIFTIALEHAASLLYARDVDIGRFKQIAAKRSRFIG